MLGIAVCALIELTCAAFKACVQNEAYETCSHIPQKLREDSYEPKVNSLACKAKSSLIPSDR